MEKTKKNKQKHENKRKACYSKNMRIADDDRIRSIVRLVARRAAEADYRELLAALEVDSEFHPGTEFRRKF